jgi:hypothetical protein
MKLKFFRVLLIALTILNSPLVLGVEYDSSSPEDARNQEIQIERQKAEAEANKLIGKTFWYVPNPKAIIRILFFPAPPINPDPRLNDEIWKDQFKPTSETTFEITSVKIFQQFPSFTSSDKYYFEVKFPDGKIGYIQSGAGKIIDSFGLEAHIYKQKAFADILEEEYVYTEPPEVVASRERKEKAKEKKAEADARAKWKAKGGVRIGMTAKQALASNWGKPYKINKSTNAYGVREQWVYEGSNYLYFENGVLTAIQN